MNQSIHYLMDSTVTDAILGIRTVVRICLGGGVAESRWSAYQKERENMVEHHGERACAANKPNPSFRVLFHVSLFV